MGLLKKYFYRDSELQGWASAIYPIHGTRCRRVYARLGYAMYT